MTTSSDIRPATIVRPSALLRLTLATALLAAFSIAAHDADILFAYVEQGNATDEISERVTLTAGTLAQLVSIGPGRIAFQQQLEELRPAIESGVWSQMPLFAGERLCGRIRTGASLQEGYVELQARFACPPGPLHQTFRLLSMLPVGYRVIVGGQLGGDRFQRFAEGDSQTVVFADGGGESGTRGRVQGLMGWIALGVEHIFGGLDHVAFLVALLLVGGNWKRVLWMVTAFTLAHSITLGATALDVIALDVKRQRWAEIAIALSIVYVALENLVLREHKHRAAITFCFGLVHGFGFASVLKSYGLGNSRVAGLLGFNLGVELGQACIVLALYPLIRLVRRRPSLSQWVVRLGSFGILSAGGYWLVERVMG